MRFCLDSLIVEMGDKFVIPFLMTGWWGNSHPIYLHKEYDMNKKLKIRLFVVFALLALGLAACDPSPSQNIVAGESLLNETFDSPDAWENYEFEGTSLSVSNGAYQIASTGEGFSWGLNDVEHTDVVIEVTAVQNLSLIHI